MMKLRRCWKRFNRLTWKQKAALPLVYLVVLLVWAGLA
jgi:hypothetical protein